jgi:hypothetical protein
MHAHTLTHLCLLCRVCCVPPLPPLHSPPQQDCPTGFGQCCSAAGQVLPASTNCTAAEDPCMLYATCDGARTTCPKKYVKNGTPCSLAAGRLFSAAATGPLGRMGTSAAISSAEANAKGFHKCHRCFKGECAGDKHKRHAGKGHDGKRKQHSGYASEGEDSWDADVELQGAADNAYSTPAEPASWFYCKN